MNYKIMIVDPSDGEPLGTFIVKGLSLKEAEKWARKKFSNAREGLQIVIERI
jgi:hypothetical protein